ncbi:hypothetical protein P170DRAFT_426002 [Aspergillus steynii IBT 23096]|uniref:Uncharacterized protein n=1 Tax=Aspergillus steynii IBT 23096 TaxID=1392250 RepID=A0A2I2G802_9EURO|nr:uncharacterized protein P170DRAFT_426002 [Aspergillus steynii IBT 23096]PLB49010.1 hypothetical protein P170DRAFT_426002 [Aspergillus steynii IBT 23096]
MDRIDFELCLDVDQHDSTLDQPDDVNITFSTDTHHHENPLPIRPRRTRTFSEIEDESTDRPGTDTDNPQKRPRVREPGDCTQPIYTLQGDTHSGGANMSGQRRSQLMDPFCPYYGSEIPPPTNPFYGMISPDDPGSFGVATTITTDAIPGPELGTRRISLSSLHRSYLNESDMASFSSTDPLPPTRFTIYEDPDGMDIDNAHIEVSHSAWPSYTRWVTDDDDKENRDADEDEDAAPETEITHAGSRHAPIPAVPVQDSFPFLSSSSTMYPVRSIHHHEQGLENTPFYAHHTQGLDNPIDTYRDQLFRRPWRGPGEGRDVSPVSPPRHSRLSDFDADDEADQDMILPNTRHSTSMDTHDQAEPEMEGEYYTGSLNSTFAEGTEMPFYSYHPLREIPSMSQFRPEDVARAPSRRARRIRAFNFPL